MDQPIILPPGDGLHALPEPRRLRQGAV